MIAPTMTSEIPVPTAPDMRSTRRPTLSIRKRAGSVLRQFTMPYTPVARRDVWGYQYVPDGSFKIIREPTVFPSSPSWLKIVGA